MTKMILTSTGLASQNIINQFLKLINKPASKIKIVFVPTASRTEEELKYVEESKRELLDFEIEEKNIKTLNLDNPIKYTEIKDYDVLYVCGGNTFYLLKKVRESGFDKIIIEFVENNKLYFGVSAGSILVCQNIEIASPGDENDVNLRDLKGLNLVDVIVSPHYCEKERKDVEKFKKKSKIPVVTLTDSQALLVIDGKKEIIE
ncbi:Type 1 glutamine amidotransferase-like domain-containing protein [Candidatus Woesearchaeota archaeon]|nr:Type 1 glutamine amidotransferase-like domain-containing protein [Candidatus Woesearchaeota archaeon]